MTKKSPTHEVIRTEAGEIELIAEGTERQMQDALLRCTEPDPEDGEREPENCTYTMQLIDWSRE